MKLIATDSYEKLSRQAANIISAQVILYPRSVLGLATGSTPLGTYAQLIKWYNKGDLDFENITTVNLDEYCGITPDNEQSYRYYMNTNFFDHININKEKANIPHGISDDFNKECEAYDKLISNLGGIDIQLLGIGHNGHIGFNEPGSSFEKTTHIVSLKQSTIDANKRFFNDISEVPTKAITMGIKSIMNAKKIVLLANGEDKHEIIEKAVFGPITPEVPASILQLHPDCTVICNVD